jgi:hypothetical protein
VAHPVEGPPPGDLTFDDIDGHSSGLKRFEPALRGFERGKGIQLDNIAPAARFSASLLHRGCRHRLGHDSPSEYQKK